MKTLGAKYQAKAIVKQAGNEVVHIWADVRSFDFKWVVPYETAFSPKILRNPSTWVMLLFGFGPLVEFSLAPSQQQLIVALVAYFALAWAAYFYVFVAIRSTNLMLGLATAAFTLLIGYPLDLLLSRVPPLSLLYGMTTAKLGVERAVGFIFGIGVEEELLKALPVLLLTFLLGRIKKPLDGIFYGALSGLGFAVNESYKFIAGMHNPAGILGQTLLRTTTLPLLHAIWTAISGYFIALAAINKHRRVALCVLGIAIAAGIHGAFDVVPDGLATVGTAGLTYLLFVSYLARGQETVRDLETAEAAASASAGGVDVVKAAHVSASSLRPGACVATTVVSGGRAETHNGDADRGDLATPVVARAAEGLVSRTSAP